MNSSVSAIPNFASSAAAAQGAAVAPELPSSPTLRDGVDMTSLIGKPHLFGWMKPLRRGFMVEPLATLTLQPDGKVGGSRHPNEGGWIAYGHSEVPASAAFAFMSRHNSWIPTSTWTQSLGDIVVGHFCEEPEADHAVQQLCLIPHAPPDDAADVIYLIASCLKFYERTVPAILAQLYAEGIPSDRIKVVVNGCDSDCDRQTEGVDYAFSTHDAWEWSALYEAPLRWRFGYAFLMHDTSVIFAGFRRSVENFNRHVAWDHLPASPLARCLLGLYSHEFLQRLNPWLEATHKISKQDGILAEVGAELLLRARTALVLGDPEYGGAARATEWREEVDQFGTGKHRRRRVFPSVRLHKFINMGFSPAEEL